MLYRNAAAPWLLAAGGVALGLVGFKAVSTLTRRGRARDAGPSSDAESPRAQHSDDAASQHSGENAAPELRHSVVQQRAFDQALLDEEIGGAAIDANERIPGDSYDAVAPDSLASEWLSRATEATVVFPSDQPIDPELAELLRDAGMSVVSEGSLNFASPDELEAAVGIDLEGPDDQFELEFDYGGVISRQ